MQEFINPHTEVSQHIMAADKIFPNNNVLPVLVYKHVFNLADDANASIIEDVFNKNNWKNSWINGIYTYHHYHTNTHEVIGIGKGTCMLMLGGDDGSLINVSKGDVVVIPAGVAHKNYGASADFECVGAYPNGSEYDLKKGNLEERALDDAAIKRVSLPETDPVFGTKGPIMEHWLHDGSKPITETARQFD
ncbi:MAG TPA: cupin [Segetibacter sp.]|jgi:uncharacterized protein YjlB